MKDKRHRKTNSAKKRSKRKNEWSLDDAYLRNFTIFDKGNKTNGS